MNSIIKKNPTIDWQNIDTVLLDMDGTILDLNFDNFFWHEYLPKFYAKKNHLTLEESQNFLRESYGAIEGKLQWYCLDFWSERLDLDIAKLKYEIDDKVCFRENAIFFLEFLVKQNKKIYLVTNAHRKSLEVKMLKTNFHQYFCELTSSHDFGYPKEEQEYWYELIEKYPFDKQRTLFIDDSLRVLHSAQKFGIGHILGIAQPDSQKPLQNCEPFEMVYDFKNII